MRNERNNGRELSRKNESPTPITRLTARVPKRREHSAQAAVEEADTLAALVKEFTHLTYEIGALVREVTSLRTQVGAERWQEYDMPYHFDFASTHKILRCKLMGDVTNESLEHVYKAVAHYAALTSPRGVIVDFSDVAAVVVSADGARLSKSPARHAGLRASLSGGPV